MNSLDLPSEDDDASPARLERVDDQRIRVTVGESSAVLDLFAARCAAEWLLTLLGWPEGVAEMISAETFIQGKVNCGIVVGHGLFYLGTDGRTTEVSKTTLSDERERAMLSALLKVAKRKANRATLMSDG